MLAAHRHRSEPGRGGRSSRRGDGANRALAHIDLVHGMDRRNFCCRPGEECFVCDVEHLTRNHLLDNRNAEVARNLQHGVVGDARTNRITTILDESPSLRLLDVLS